MRTERLFYKDSHQTTCQAKVLVCREVKKGYEILLDQTVFYPEGGGQPCDIGTMNRVEVMDVQKRTEKSGIGRGKRSRRGQK